MGATGKSGAKAKAGLVRAIMADKGWEADARHWAGRVSRSYRMILLEDGEEKTRKSANATNSAMGPRQVKAHCKLDSESTGYLEHAMEEMNFSARAHDRILKVARTLADLSGAPEIRPNDVLEAIQYRSLDRKLFS